MILVALRSARKRCCFFSSSVCSRNASAFACARTGQTETFRVHSFLARPFSDLQCGKDLSLRLDVTVRVGELCLELRPTVRKTVSA